MATDPGDRNNTTQPATPPTTIPDNQSPFTARTRRRHRTTHTHITTATPQPGLPEPLTPNRHRTIPATLLLLAAAGDLDMPATGTTTVPRPRRAVDTLNT